MRIEISGRAQDDLNMIHPGTVFWFGSAKGSYAAIRAIKEDVRGFVILLAPPATSWSGEDLDGDRTASVSSLKPFEFYEDTHLGVDYTVYELLDTCLIASPHQEAIVIGAGGDWTPGSLYVSRNQSPWMAISSGSDRWQLDPATGAAAQPQVAGRAVEIKQWAVFLEISGKRVKLFGHPIGSTA